MRIEEETHPLILSRYALIVFSLATVWENTALNYRSPIPNFFLVLMRLLKQILARPLISPDAIRLHHDASVALNQLILSGSNVQTLNNELHALFMTTLDELDSSQKNIRDDKIRFIIQTHLCSNLTVLSMRMSGEIDKNDLYRALDLLFNILRQDSDLIYDEALLTLAQLYCDFNRSFREDDIVIILRIVPLALNSESPGAITSASFLEFLNIEEQILRNSPHLRESHPFIVETIAEMFQGVGRCEQHKALINTYESRLFQLLQFVRSVSIDVTNESDVSDANNLFEYVAFLYEVYAVLYYPITGDSPTADQRAKKRKVLDEMVAFAKVLVNLHNVSDIVLTRFVYMVQAFGEHCTRVNNTRLNKWSVHKVLEMAQSKERTHCLVKMSRNALAFIRGR
jgi:hypothetical protein